MDSDDSEWTLLQRIRDGLAAVVHRVAQSTGASPAAIVAAGVGIAAVGGSVLWRMARRQRRQPPQPVQSSPLRSPRSNGFRPQSARSVPASPSGADHQPPQQPQQQRQEHASALSRASSAPPPSGRSMRPPGSSGPRTYLSRTEPNSHAEDSSDGRAAFAGGVSSGTSDVGDLSAGAGGGGGGSGWAPAQSSHSAAPAPRMISPGPSRPRTPGVTLPPGAMESKYEDAAVTPSRETSAFSSHTHPYPNTLMPSRTEARGTSTVNSTVTVARQQVQSTAWRRTLERVGASTVVLLLLLVAWCDLRIVFSLSPLLWLALQALIAPVSNGAPSPMDRPLSTHATPKALVDKSFHGDTPATPASSHNGPHTQAGVVWEETSRSSHAQNMRYTTPGGLADATQRRHINQCTPVALRFDSSHAQSGLHSSSGVPYDSAASCSPVHPRHPGRSPRSPSHATTLRRRRPHSLAQPAPTADALGTTRVVLTPVRSRASPSPVDRAPLSAGSGDEKTDYKDDAVPAPLMYMAGDDLAQLAKDEWLLSLLPDVCSAMTTAELDAEAATAEQLRVEFAYPWERVVDEYWTFTNTMLAEARVDAENARARSGLQRGDHSSGVSDDDDDGLLSFWKRGSATEATSSASAAARRPPRLPSLANKPKYRIIKQWNDPNSQRSYVERHILVPTQVPSIIRSLVSGGAAGGKDSCIVLKERAIEDRELRVLRLEACNIDYSTMVVTKESRIISANPSMPSNTIMTQTATIAATASCGLLRGTVRSWALKQFNHTAKETMRFMEASMLGLLDGALDPKASV